MFYIYISESISVFDRKPAGASHAKYVVGVGGFEPPTSCSQSMRANLAALHPDIIKLATYCETYNGKA